MLLHVDLREAVPKMVILKPKQLNNEHLLEELPSHHRLHRKLCKFADQLCMYA